MKVVLSLFPSSLPPTETLDRTFLSLSYNWLILSKNTCWIMLFVGSFFGSLLFFYCYRSVFNLFCFFLLKRKKVLAKDFLDRTKILTKIRKKRKKDVWSKMKITMNFSEGINGYMSNILSELTYINSVNSHKRKRKIFDKWIWSKLFYWRFVTWHKRNQ